MPLKLIGRTFSTFENALARQIEAHVIAGGEPVECEFLEVEEIEERLVRGEAATDGSVDVVMLPGDWYPTLLAHEKLICLDEFLQNDPPRDWPEGWPASLRTLQCDRRGRTFGTPYHDGPEMLIYRTDLFGDRSNRRRFREQFGRDLRPPETWSEFLEVAYFFTDPERDQYGTLLAAFPDAHNIIYDFFLGLWTRGGEVIDEQGGVAFDGPAGQASLEFLVDLIHTYRVVPPDVHEIDSIASGDRFNSGQVAMMVNWTGFAAYADTAATSQVGGKVGCTLVPRDEGPEGRHVSMNNYWCLSIPVGSRRQQAAYHFLKHTCGPEMDRITTEEAAIGCRLSTWRHPDFQAIAGYSLLERLHENTRSAPAIAEYEAISRVLNRELDLALRAQKAPNDALRAAAEACRQVLRR